MAILYLAAILVVVLLIVIAARPSEFTVSRATTISAPAEVVFAQVNDLHQWEAWSPWAKLDPKAKTSYAGAAAGVGASFSWSGNMQVGQGRMTITENRPPELIRIQLDFVKPIKGTNMAEFSFKPAAGGTAVNWSMTGKNSFMAKTVGLFLNCDKMVGEMFEKGLADLKSTCETSAGK